jgi:hypothetical protein
MVMHSFHKPSVWLGPLLLLLRQVLQALKYKRGVEGEAVAIIQEAEPGVEEVAVRILRETSTLVREFPLLLL